MADTLTATSIVSLFDVNAEGWVMQGDVSTFGWQATGGNPGGHLNWTDAVTGNVCFYTAPEEFLGDKSAYYGGVLSFDLRDTAGTNFDDRDLVLTGGGLTIVYDFALPGTAFTHYAIALDAAAGWKIDTLAGAAATEAQIRQVLAGMTQLLIRAEFVTGFEEGDLDNVVLSRPGAPGYTFERFSSLAQTTLEGVYGSFAQSLVTATAGDAIVFVNPPAIALGLGNQAVAIDNLTVQAGATLDAVFQLGAGVASFTLAGATNADVSGNGNANIVSAGSGGNTLNGGGGNDTLDGGAGIDSMIGGAEDDIYVVDNASDSTVEAGGGGIDTVRASVTHVLRVNVENLELQRSANINGTGNVLDNTITGNAGANILNGLAGADQMAGLAGNDTYYVDNVGDTVTEALAGGIDIVRSTVSSILGAEIEKLYLLGTAANATGNTLTNFIYGNTGANIIDGGAGADRLFGNTGGDTFIVDSAGDLIYENAAGGTDTVQSSVNHTLAANVENLILTGVANINGTGNTLANVIVGNSGNNFIDGKLGSDTLTGGLGIDQFLFTTALGASNIDAIADFSVPNDTIRLDDTIFAGLALGYLNAAAFVIGAAAADASDRIVYDSATGAVFFDADGSGAVVAQQFAILSAGLAMTAGDFYVF